MTYLSVEAIQEGYNRAMRFYEKCIVPDRTPVMYNGKVIGHTIGENNCKSPITIELYPFEVSFDFNDKSYQKSESIEITSLTIGDTPEFEVKL